NRDDIELKIAPVPNQSNPGYRYLRLTSDFHDTAIGREYLDFQENAVRESLDPALDKIRELVSIALGDFDLSAVGAGSRDELVAAVGKARGPLRAQLLTMAWRFSREVEP